MAGRPYEIAPLDWKMAYEAVLQESDTVALFRRVEIAEAAIRLRLDAIAKRPYDEERYALENALTNLQVIKRERLEFDIED